MTRYPLTRVTGWWRLGRREANSYVGIILNSLAKMGVVTLIPPSPFGF